MSYGQQWTFGPFDIVKCFTVALHCWSVPFYRAAWNATRSYDEISVCPSVRPSVCSSVCLSVKHVHCDKTKEKSVQIFIPRERAFTLVF